MQESGKSSLIKRLQDPFGVLQLNLAPTVGSDITELRIKKHVVRLREVSFMLINDWPSYIEKSRVIYFVVDASNYLQLSSAAVEFFNIMSQIDDKNIKLYLLFNKFDLENSVRFNLVRCLFFLDEL